VNATQCLRSSQWPSPNWPGSHRHSTAGRHRQAPSPANRTPQLCCGQSIACRHWRRCQDVDLCVPTSWTYADHSNTVATTSGEKFTMTRQVVGISLLHRNVDFTNLTNFDGSQNRRIFDELKLKNCLGICRPISFDNTLCVGLYIKLLLVSFYD